MLTDIITAIFIIANMLCATLNIDVYVHKLDVTSLLVAAFNLSAVIILARNNISSKIG